MQLTFQQLDIDEFRRTNRQPAVVINRKRDEEWHVAGSPIELDKPISWLHVKDGQGVYIPMVPYRLPHDANLALTDMVSRAMRAGYDINQKQAPKRLHIVTATLTEDLTEEGFEGFMRFHLGIAVQTR